MKKALQTRVLETIDRHSLIQAGDRVGMGVSGGADSVALLRLLGELQSRLGISLLVLHFHHQLRGADADADEAFVANLARELGLDFVADRADVAAEANRHGWNLEDAARRLRYGFFASAAASHGLNRVAVAHSADDQAETVLAHLLRGTGPAGLAGIYPLAGLVIRPLLDVRRSDLREYLLLLNQPWREDTTNQDTTRTRARIRHQLLPFLEREFESATVERLTRLAGLAREEEMFWRALEDERFWALVAGKGPDGFSIAITDLLSPFASAATGNARPGLPVASALALTRRLLRRIYFELRGTRQQLTARHIEDVLHLATKGQSGSRVRLPGVVVQRVFDRLKFSCVEAQSRTERTLPDPLFEYTITRPDQTEASVVVPEISRRFSLKIVDWPSRERETIAETSALDFDRLRWPLTLRNWRPGDSYRPHRRHRVRKLKRLLRESRIPLGDRAGWPVLISEGALVWAWRYPVADEFAPQPGTRSGLVIAEEQF